MLLNIRPTPQTEFPCRWTQIHLNAAYVRPYEKKDTKSRALTKGRYIMPSMILKDIFPPPPQRRIIIKLKANNNKYKNCY